MKHPFVNLLVRWAVLALGVALAAALIPGIQYTNGTTLLVVVLLLSFFNAILRPILLLFTLPFIVLTLGLGVLVINALLFLLVGQLVEGFTVAGFWSALGGAIIVSLTNVVVSQLFREPPRGPPSGPGPRPPTRPPVTGGKDGDVIDI